MTRRPPDLLVANVPSEGVPGLLPKKNGDLRAIPEKARHGDNDASSDLMKKRGKHYIPAFPSRFPDHPAPSTRPNPCHRPSRMAESFGS